jgi:hypothetical protein
MDNFYWIVLTLASLVLIGLLSFIGWTMANQKKGTKYPTATTTCPDNWIPVKDSNNKVYCQRPTATGFNKGSTDLNSYITDSSKAGYTALKGNGTTASTSGSESLLNFNADEWGKDGNPVCAKRDWAHKYGVKWDSVENANFC